MDLVGEWVLRWCYGCNGSYASSKLNISGDGTFTVSGSKGIWREVNGMVLLMFNDSKVTYAGNANGSAIVGAMVAVSQSIYPGCWYATRDVSASNAKAARQDFDPVGKKISEK